MNKNEQDFLVQKILTQYTEDKKTVNKGLEELKTLDKEVKRPANTFAYTFGIVGSLILGCGMSMLMTDIGGRLGDVTVPGVIVGIVGLAMTIMNYPIYKKILKKRRDKYADQIIALSDKLMSSEE